MTIGVYDLEAERSIIGAALLDENALPAVIDILSWAYFYDTKHQNIFAIMEGMFAEKKPIDLVSVTNELREKQRIEAAGGASYLADCAASLPDAANVLHYAKIVRGKSVKRGLIAANQTSTAAAESDWPVDQVLEDQQHAIQELQEKILGDGEPEQVGLPAARVVKRIEAIKSGEIDGFGWKTGIKALDSHFGYLAPKNLYIIAGGVSAGKSALVDQISDQVAADGGTVAIFCLEMSLEQRAERFLARRTNTSLQTFKDPQYIPAVGSSR
jgi:replicative DNA helicase